MKLAAKLVLITLGCALAAGACGRKKSEKRTVLAPVFELIPRPEHPRPDFNRDTFFNLNGVWSFAYDPDDRGLSEQWFNAEEDVFPLAITVPFCWESPASGLGDPVPDPWPILEARENVSYSGVAWYRRSFKLPLRPTEKAAAEDDYTYFTPGARTFLIFGASDWWLTVWVNGVEVCSSDNGWLPLECDITDAINPYGENVIVARAEDTNDLTGDLPKGKQGDFWYRRVSGLWQTVYLEQRPDTYISYFKYVSRIADDGAKAWIDIEAEVEAAVGGPASINVALSHPANAQWFSEPGTSVVLAPGRNTVRWSLRLHDQISVRAPYLWSPQEPNLYGGRLSLATVDEIDQVNTYFGVREITLDWAPDHGPDDGVAPAEQYKWIYLNGKPVYLRGLLDQGYYPESHYTAPGISRFVEDLEAVKAGGTNMLRTHIKTEEPYKLYLADKAGVLVMADVPSLDIKAVNEPGFIGRYFYEQTLRAMIRRDFNHPSIFSWVVFNESWGLIQPSPIYDNEELRTWVDSMTDLARELDPTRPVEDNSTTDVLTGYYEHYDTDINSWHYYTNDYADWRNEVQTTVDGTYPGSEFRFVGGAVQDGDPLLMSEYSGLTALLSGDEDGSFYYAWMTNELRLHNKICGFVFTELTDVEWEHNGLLRYDRSLKETGYEFFGSSMALRNAADQVFINYTPVTSAVAGTSVDIEYGIHAVESTIGTSRVFADWGGLDTVGRRVAERPLGYKDLSYEIDAPPLVAVTTQTFTLPADLALAWLRVYTTSNRLELGPDNEVSSAYYVVFDLGAGQAPRAATETVDGRLAAVARLNPGDFSTSSFSGGDARPTFDEQEGYAAMGEGSLEYEFALPAGFDYAGAASAEIIFEISAAGALPFPPQTYAGSPRSLISVAVAGRSVFEAELVAGADSRGVLTYLNEKKWAGSYGTLVRAVVEGDAMDALRAQAAAGGITVELGAISSEGAGIRVFGDRMGLYPLDPTLIVWGD